MNLWLMAVKIIEIWKHTKNELGVLLYVELQVASNKRRVASWKSRVASYNCRVASWKSRVASWNCRVASWKNRVASCSSKKLGQVGKVE